MPRFYTKTGDDGYTSHLGKGRVPKYDPQIETVGDIDEANAAIALARTLSLSPRTISILIKVQNDLYHIMSELASTTENAVHFRKISSESVKWLEDNIDDISSQVVIPDEFIIPGDSKAGAAIDLARTIIRRAERRVAQLLHLKKLDNPSLLHYMNRLSSLCFLLELLENQAAGIDRTTITEK